MPKKEKQRAEDRVVDVFVEEIFRIPGQVRVLVPAGADICDVVDNVKRWSAEHIQWSRPAGDFHPVSRVVLDIKSVKVDPNASETGPRPALLNPDLKTTGPGQSPAPWPSCPPGSYVIRYERVESRTAAMACAADGSDIARKWRRFNRAPDAHLDYDSNADAQVERIITAIERDESQPE